MVLSRRLMRRDGAEGPNRLSRLSQVLGRGCDEDWGAVSAGMELARKSARRAGSSGAGRPDCDPVTRVTLTAAGTTTTSGRWAASIPAISTTATWLPTYLYGWSLEKLSTINDLGLKGPGSSILPS